MKTMRKLAVVVLLGSLCAIQGGCLAVAAGAGAGAGAMYLRGDVKATLDAPVQQVVAAAEQAIRQMELNLISSEVTAVDGKVIARTAQDARVTIVVESRTPSTSEISVRIGTFGDHPLSQQILDNVKANL